MLQPHTSAGRIPSQEAYELYIKKILNVNNTFIDNNEIKRNLVFNNINKITYLIEQSLNILSSETDYTAIALSQRNFSKNVITRINITKIDKSKIVIVVILNNGEVKNTIVNLDFIVESTEVLVLEKVFNEILIGMSIEDITEDIIQKVLNLIEIKIVLVRELIKAIINLLKEVETLDLSLIGTTKMFNQPEFSDINKAKSLIEFLANKDDVKKLLNTKGIDKNGLNIILGNENMGEVAKDVAIISADINYNGNVIGKIGIIAPKRMDYNKAYSVVNYIQSQINSIINNL